MKNHSGFTSGLVSISGVTTWNEKKTEEKELSDPGNPFPSNVSRANGMRIRYALYLRLPDGKDSTILHQGDPESHPAT
jgi:hypothetical protein